MKPTWGWSWGRATRDVIGTTGGNLRKNNGQELSSSGEIAALQSSKRILESICGHFRGNEPEIHANTHTVNKRAYAEEGENES